MGKGGKEEGREGGSLTVALNLASVDMAVMTVIFMPTDSDNVSPPPLSNLHLHIFLLASLLHHPPPLLLLLLPPSCSYRFTVFFDLLLKCLNGLLHLLRALRGKYTWKRGKRRNKTGLTCRWREKEENKKNDGKRNKMKTEERKIDAKKKKRKKVGRKGKRKREWRKIKRRQTKQIDKDSEGGPPPTFPSSPSFLFSIDMVVVVVVVVVINGGLVGGASDR
jgi:hypothetical protein